MKFLLLTVGEGNSQVEVLQQGLEGEASISAVVHNEGQPLNLGVVASATSREG